MTARNESEHEDEVMSMSKMGDMRETIQHNHEISVDSRSKSFDLKPDRRQSSYVKDKKPEAETKKSVPLD